MLTVTKAGFGKNRSVRWFCRMLLKISLHVENLLADGALRRIRGTNKITRNPEVERLFHSSTLNPRNCEGNTPEEEMERCKEASIQMALQELLPEVVG
jgi:hypothetical protein